MNNWQNYKLGDICSIKGGKRLPAGHELTSIQTKHPYIKARDIRNGKIATANLEFISEITHNLISRYIVRANDVCITIVANIGDAGIVPAELDNANLTENALRLTSFKNNIDPKFLCYVLSSKTYKSYCESLAAGAAQAKLGIYKVKTINILLPPLPEQQRIASILSAYDDLIENNNKRIALLEQMAEQIYKEWFVRMRFPGYENAEFEKGVPKGWEVKPLSSIANILMGQSPKSEFYNDAGIGLPFHQGVGSYGKRFPTHDTFCSTNGRQAKEGDILFSVRAPVGRINIADQKLIIGRGLGATRHKQGFQSYLFYLLNYYFQLEDVIGNGSIFNSVGKDELNKFKILQPSNELDKKFNDFVLPMDKQLQILFQQNKLLKQTRDLLLPRLISGKLRVKEIKEAQLSKAEV